MLCADYLVVADLLLAYSYYGTEKSICIWQACVASSSGTVAEQTICFAFGRLESIGVV